MTSISSLGIGSGLDLNGLLDKMSRTEQLRLAPYTAQQSSHNAKLTAYGTLKNALEKFDNLSKDLAKRDFFDNTSASAHEQFSVTTNAKSVPGNYHVDVLQLAQPQTLVSMARIADQTTALGTQGATERTLSITAGYPPKNVTLTLSDSQTSLVEIRDAINTANAGVKV